MSKERRDFLWVIAALAALIFVAAFGAYSGRCSSAESCSLYHAIFVNVATTDIMLVIFTGLLVYVGWLQTRQLHRTNESARTVERAYVTLSHQRPGVQYLPAVDRIAVHVRVRNFGRTPGKVSDAAIVARIHLKDEPLPEAPDYAEPRGLRPKRAFLVTEDEFFFVQEIRMNGAWPRIQNGELKLYILGYVDYIDMFNQRSRAGYAREYDPARDVRREGVSEEAFANRTNLVFVSQDGYNYDRPRQRGEGID